jgi:lysophospholipase L1-like esterase
MKPLVLTAVVASLLMAGCGGSDDPMPSDDQGPGKTVVAALGDSITAGNPAFDPDPAQRERLGFGDDETSQYEYWAQRADPAFEFRNCGVFGQRTDEVAARLDECASGADALIVQGGINDIAQGRSIEYAADDLDRMVGDGLDRDLDVYLVDVLPWNNGHPQADGPIAELNRRIEAIGRERGVPVIGFHDALSDPAEPELMKPALTADGDHPSIAGYRILGERAAQVLGRRSSAGGSPDSP